MTLKLHQKGKEKKKKSGHSRQLLPLLVQTLKQISSQANFLEEMEVRTRSQAYTNTLAQPSSYCTWKTKTTTHMYTHTSSIFKVIKRGDFKCSYLFGACCRGNSQCDCAGSLEFLSSCGVRPPCVPLPIFPDPNASPWG